MTRNEDALAKCPFYEMAADGKIRCETCVEAARVYFGFRNAEEMIRHKRTYCDTLDWEKCGYARMMLADWEARHGKI